jgi:hypothetical protein
MWLADHWHDLQRYKLGINHPTSIRRAWNVEQKERQRAQLTQLTVDDPVHATSVRAGEVWSQIENALREHDVDVSVMGLGAEERAHREAQLRRVAALVADVIGRERTAIDQIDEGQPRVPPIPSLKSRSLPQFLIELNACADEAVEA